MGTKWVQPFVDLTRCTRCGLCVEACPCHAIRMEEQGPIFACPESCRCGDSCTKDCTGWCVCEEVCPSGAIECAFEIVLEEKETTLGG